MTTPSALTNPTWTCFQRWWRAVDTAGLGFYTSATEQLAEVTLDCRQLPSPDGFLLTALALSTQASWERQTGHHDVAAQLDNKALEILESELPSEDGGMDADTAAYVYHIAVADAVTGRAADCLGGDHPDVAVAREWVDKADGVLMALHERAYPERLVMAIEEDPTDSMWGHCGLNAARVVIRQAWVSAETAMSEHRWEHAQACAAQGVDLSGEWLSPRHHVKSLLVDAAATAGTDPSPAVGKAARAYLEAEECGFLPLQWAAATLLESLPSEDHDSWATMADTCLRQLAERGGNYSRG